METANTYPVVSVVIPVFNRSRLLEKAIRSVLDQTYPYTEIIVADDGSTDDPGSVIDKVHDSRIRFIPLAHTGHIGITRNAGAAVATGKWIAFLDSDDTWHPEKLQRQIKKLEQTGKEWCYCGFRHVDESGNCIPAKAGKYRAHEGWITKALLTYQASVMICTLIAERDFFLRTGGFCEDPRLTLRGDYELALRLSQHAEAAALPETLVNILEHEGRVTRSIKDPYLRSMMPYVIFLETATDPGFRKIAHRQISRLIQASGAKKKRNLLNLSSFHVRRFLFPVKKQAKIS